MSTQLVSEEAAVAGAPRARAITALGPATMLAGVVWAFVQPYRVTLLHPHGQGFWWLVVEPPLLVVLAGVVFALLVAPGVIEDLEGTRTTLMQPPAELVHWMFATGFVLLGLCLLAEAIVGRRGLAPPRVARLPLAEPRLRDGRADVAGDGLLHQLDDPHGRPRLVGAGADAGRRRRARPRARQAAQPATGG